MKENSIEKVTKTMELWNELINIQETILFEYERVLQENKVLLKENEKIKEANDYYALRYCKISNDSIAIQKVKDKIEKYQNMLQNLNKKADTDRIKAINERILAYKDLLGGEE